MLKFLLSGLVLLAFTLPAHADESKEEKSKMPKGIGYGKSMKAPGYAKTAPVRAAKPGPARATAAKAMPRPTRRGK